MIQAILYDLDGTLANTDPIHFQTWKTLLVDHGLEIDHDFYQQNFSGRLNPDIVKDLLPHLSVEEGQDLSDRKEALFRQWAREQLQPLAGLTDLINWGHRHQVRQAVVTNAPRLNANFMLETLHLTDTFEFVVLADTLPKGKPDPLPYQTGLDQLQLQPDDVITFEDSPSGIRSSVAAGISTIGVATTHQPDLLYDLGAVLVIDDFTDPRIKPFLGLSADAAIAT
jgi:HAD superfamily hydrolase (TIGR01509 family)